MLQVFPSIKLSNLPHNPSSTSDNSISSENPAASGTVFFITDDGYLIFNYQVVKDATKVRLRTGAGLIVPKWFRWMRPMIWLC